MAIQASLYNLFYFIGRLAPMLMVFFFVFVSIVNQDWRGVLYLSGVVLSCVFAILTSNTFTGMFLSNSGDVSMCSMTETQYSKIPLSSVILGFTIVYILFPMIQKHGKISNPYLFSVFLFFVAVDAMFLIKHKCSVIDSGLPTFINTFIPIAIGYIFGFIVAQIYVLVLSSTNNDNLLYYGSSKGGITDTKCNVANNNKFVCKVYKNGELLTT